MRPPWRPSRWPGAGIATQETTDKMLTNAPPPLSASTGANALVTETNPEVVGLELGAGVVERRLQRVRRPADSGVVDDDLDVGRLFGGRGDRVGIGDVERDRRQPVVGDRGRVAHRGVDLRGAAGEQLLGDRLADPAVGAGDERD